ncbi:4a-hydroxytetrahydrobiopterin dehydratase [Vulcanococcus sp. Clear-D1]|jgi:4a-hydroxytetrahydrobiopterin dehydratase|uniref:4a-hydroxytetrahydrobiopterin dehydratase n=1 Tax=Vulcanococcus sp. Clear-D1 TaxID=2766970 RepID=UPI0019AFA2D0|nr:4a-hydroxytetrahydrobiopterin dehydratase [Vulcanococcus sp. Clear-D1]MBD1192811.1 4a-hydroxytetrahydrobiopterin dehydratase [Vulcanococcus sp. Clear-D1]
MDLATQTCIPCREGAPTPTKAELEALLPQLPGWSVVEQHHLQRSLLFPDFQSALDWVIAAGAICEGQGHHAEFTLGWGHAEAVIYTHKVNGLTQADVVLAAKFNQIGSGPG